MRMIKLLPHQIACALYIELILSKFKEHVVSAQSQQKMLLFALKLIRDSDVMWKEMQVQLRSVLEDADISTLFKKFHKLQYTEELMEAIKSFEILLDATKSQNGSDVPNGFLSRSSVLGTFLRKLILEFKKMPFDTVNDLRVSILEYLNSSEPVQTSKYLQCDSSSIDISATDMSCMEDSLMEGEKENITCKPEDSSFEGKKSFASSDEILLSRNQVMRFITEQVKYVENHDKNAFPPDKLQEKIAEIRQLYPDIKEVYYLSFMNYLRVSESNKASISLQLYFDYKEFAGKTNDGDISELEKHQLKFKAFRYCALNLGIMHCQQGNYSQAMISLEECIQIAQETNDQKCLNNAMFWLSVVKEEINQTNEGSSHLKAFVADTAKKIMDTESNSNLQEIDYLGLLRYTKLQAFKGLITPSKALAIISQIVSELKVANCAQLTRSSLLDFYGFKHCAAVDCQVPLQGMKVVGASGKVCVNMIKNKYLAIALCQLASLHAGENCYDEAECILSFTKQQFSVYSSFQKTIMLCELEIKFKYNVEIRNLEEASEIGQCVSRIDELQGKYMVAVVDLLLGNISSSLSAATSLLALIEKSSIATKQPILKVKLLMLMIEIRLLSANASNALDLICKLINFVNANSMHGLQIDANLCLIRFQLHLGLTGKAKLIVDKTLYKALAFGSYYQQGLLFYYKAKCLMSEDKPAEDRSAFLQEAYNILNKCIGYFSKCNSDARKKDVLYEQAFISHQLGYFQERNKISTQFRMLHEKLEGILPVMMF